MMATLYDVSVAAINQHIKKVYDDAEIEPDSTTKKYLIVQTEDNRQVSSEVAHYNLQMIIFSKIVKTVLTRNRTDGSIYKLTARNICGQEKNKMKKVVDK
jgi:hypothetical protein